jgi:peptidoglycan/xylan/chitin deacetylase (PgdA/CDA1 family)
MRQILANAIRHLGFHLQRKKPPFFMVTHDVESERGFARTLSMKAVEDELNIKSLWFIPSHEYPINRSIAADLAEGATIGSHDFKHDGRLIHIHRQSELVQRVSESKLRLEEIFGQVISQFRSPLLQFSRELASALVEAKYQSDFSIPCWEPVNPMTMNGFGVESAQPFEIDGLIETPLTLFQDHQVLNVLGMNTHEAIKLWLEQAKLIRSFNGDIVLLIHPEYAFSLDLDAYRKLLVSLSELHLASDHSAIAS